MISERIEIKETQKDDLRNLLGLWNDGEVMKFVGFPNGLGETIEGLEKWYLWIEESRPICNHYSVYSKELGYCGETFYRIDKEHSNSASLDIKLLPIARGKGIATIALSYAIERAFDNGADKVWVDPNPQNEKAIALYTRLNFVKKDMPEYLKEEEQDIEFVPIYMELLKENR